MSILTILLVIVVVGVVLWAINQYVPMAPPIKNLLNIVIILILVVWLLSAFGLFDVLGRATVPRAH